MWTFNVFWSNVMQWQHARISKQADFCFSFNSYTRPLVKSGKQKNNFLISQPKHMLWVLKRTVSMRRFFWAPKTFAYNIGKKIFTILHTENFCLSKHVVIILSRCFIFSMDFYGSVCKLTTQTIVAVPTIRLPPHKTNHSHVYKHTVTGIGVWVPVDYGLTTDKVWLV